jgi:hypothetical protein
MCGGVLLLPLLHPRRLRSIVEDLCVWVCVCVRSSLRCVPRLEVVTAPIIKSTIFCNVMPYSQGKFTDVSGG